MVPGSWTLMAATRVFLKLTLHSGSSAEGVTFLIFQASLSPCTGDSRNTLRVPGAGGVAGVPNVLQLRGLGTLNFLVMSNQLKEVSGGNGQLLSLILKILEHGMLQLGSLFC